MEFDTAIKLATDLRDEGYGGTLNWAASEPRTATVEIPLVGGVSLARIQQLGDIAASHGVGAEARDHAIRFQGGT